MSFAYDVKNELCGVMVSGCCKIAECYGILLFNRAFSYRNISLLTEHEQVAKRCAYLIKSAFSVTASIHENEGRNGLYKVSVDNEIDRKKVMTGFGFKPTDMTKSINKSLVTRDCCAAAFIRGAFLACGSISDPKKEYHAEFTISDFLLADEFYRFLKERSLKVRKSLREQSNILYFKETTSMEDLLTLMGASLFSLELMEIKIYKDMRNKINRINNCETANISKTVEACIVQKSAINYLISQGLFDTLPENLKSVAELRLKYPDAPLSQLVKLTEENLTRSGLNHRLQKIILLAEDAKRNNQK